MHSFFTWDDSKAARLFRLQEAHKLILNVEVVISESDQEKKTIHAYYNLERKQGYENTVHAMSNAEKRAQLLDKAMREMISWRDKYKALKEFAEIHEAIDRAAKKRKK